MHTRHSQLADYKMMFQSRTSSFIKVWIEVAEKKLPGYTRASEVEAVKVGLIAARQILESR